jgi:hypothetical protein
MMWNGPVLRVPGLPERNPPVHAKAVTTATTATRAISI